MKRRLETVYFCSYLLPAHTARSGGTGSSSVWSPSHQILHGPVDQTLTSGRTFGVNASQRSPIQNIMQPTVCGTDVWTSELFTALITVKLSRERS